MRFSVISVECLLVAGRHEVVINGRNKQGQSVCVRIEHYAVNYAIMQDIDHFKHEKLHPEDYSMFPVTKRSFAHNECVTTLLDLDLVPTYRFSSRYGGAAMAIAELGVEEPNCLGVKIVGRNRDDVDRVLGKIRRRLGKFAIRVLETERGAQSEALLLLDLGLDMYGSYEIIGGSVPDVQVSTHDYEFIVEACHLQKLNDLLPIHPRILLFDLEQAAAYNDNFSSTDTGEDIVFMCAAMIRHKGHADDGKRFLIVTNPHVPGTIQTESGEITVIATEWRDEFSLWRGFWMLVSNVLPDWISAWNGNGYDFRVAFERFYSFSRGRVVHPDHPARLPTTIVDMSRIRDMPLPVSRFNNTVQPITKFVEVTSVWMNGARNYLPQTPGIKWVDLMMLYKTILDPRDGLGLSACAKRHGVVEKMHFPYHELSLAIRSSTWHGIVGEYNDDTMFATLDDERRGTIIRAIMHIIPRTTAQTILKWMKVFERASMGDIVRILQLWDAKVSATKMSQAIEYCMTDVDAMDAIIHAVKYWNMINLYGNLQMLPPDLLVSVGQVKRVLQAYVIKAYSRKFAMENNWHKKIEKYGGGQVLQPDLRMTVGRAVTITDYDALYPSIIISRNLCISTYIPNWLSIVLPSWVEQNMYYSHRPTEHVTPKIDLPWASAFNPHVVDQVNVEIDDDQLIHIMVHPTLRFVNTIMQCEVFTEHNVLQQLWESDVMLSVRNKLLSKVPKEGFAAIAAGTFSTNMNVFVYLTQDYAHNGAPYYTPSRIWLWEGVPVNKISITGGKKTTPIFLGRSTSTGIVPDICIDYLSARGEFKKDMKKIKAIVNELIGLQANGEPIPVEYSAEIKPGTNIEIVSSWPQQLAESYDYADGAQSTVKVGVNSVYGALGANGKMYHPAVPMLITSLGRQDIGWLHDAAKARGYDSVYGDTDSVMPTKDIASFGATSIEDLIEKADSWANGLADDINAQLKQIHPNMGVSNDGVTLYFLPFYKKKYAYVKLSATKLFFDLNPIDPNADVEKVMKCVKYKGLSVVKSDQTPWGMRTLGHLIAAGLAGATPEQLEVIYQHHYSLLATAPAEDCLKTITANLLKAGAGNDAARAAVRAGEYIGMKQSISFAATINGEYHTMITARPEDIDRRWVADQIEKEYNRLKFVVALRTT